MQPIPEFVRTSANRRKMIEKAYDMTINKLENPGGFTKKTFKIIIDGGEQAGRASGATDKQIKFVLQFRKNSDFVMDYLEEN